MNVFVGVLTDSMLNPPVKVCYPMTTTTHLSNMEPNLRTSTFWPICWAVGGPSLIKLDPSSLNQKSINQK